MSHCQLFGQLLRVWIFLPIPTSIEIDRISLEKLGGGSLLACKDFGPRLDDHVAGFTGVHRPRCPLLGTIKRLAIGPLAEKSVDADSEQLAFGSGIGDDVLGRPSSDSADKLD